MSKKDERRALLLNHAYGQRSVLRPATGVDVLSVASSSALFVPVQLLVSGASAVARWLNSVTWQDSTISAVVQWYSNAVVPR